MSKKVIVGKARMMNKAVEKVVHGNKLSTTIPSGMAAPGPPLGPMLGQRGINIAAFCKDFNNRTSVFKEGIPLPCRITINADRSYDLRVQTPTVTYFLKQAAGIERAAMQPGKEISGKVTLRHIYEIAKIKKQDRPLLLTPMRHLVGMIVGSAHTLGIEVVDELDAEEYGSFLEERTRIVTEQLDEIQEKKEAKLLRK